SRLAMACRCRGGAPVRQPGARESLVRRNLYSLACQARSEPYVYSHSRRRAPAAVVRHRVGQCAAIRLIRVRPALTVGGPWRPRRTTYLSNRAGLQVRAKNSVSGRVLGGDLAVGGLLLPRCSDVPTAGGLRVTDGQRGDPRRLAGVWAG